MKSMLLFAASLAALSGISQEETLTKVISGLQAGNVSAIEAQLLNEVDLTVFDFEDFCNKPQVKAKLSDFFSAHKPSGFSVIHKGSSVANEVYRIGELATSTGTYRVTIFIEKSSSAFKVSQLKIE